MNKSTELARQPTYPAIPVLQAGLLVIGDVHGKIDSYWKILQKNKNSVSIQVGDFGFRNQHIWHLKNFDSANHKINFGNHDDTMFLNKPHSMGNFSGQFKNIMTVRGAFSIDRYHRTEYKDWWANEELTYNEMQEAIDFNKGYKPKIMITHDCPQEVKEHFFGIEQKSITTNGLQVMFENHQPDVWIFGHHHKSINEVINGTRFICLAELETVVV